MFNIKRGQLASLVLSDGLIKVQAHKCIVLYLCLTQAQTCVQ
ncbi:hypothetical protein HMPREF3232_01334 [Fannyhessea vaginae]|uniref:Uncharacterized protein n=1 Tax=Fannyhessea vaginae DSM 15829 TaxID=525256 RepID=F1T3G9_9ACTN|nr:hypothetical protein HMPREF0091_10210 [Fannyhessea vaginae DSM 15829]KXG88446.1 hypothetical protein HMPREF3232_01334 [Fannyhessea vaginae]